MLWNSGVGNSDARPISLRCPHCHQMVSGRAIGHDAVFGRLTDNRTRLTPEVRGIRQCPNVTCNGPIFIVRNDANELIASFPPQILHFDTSNMPPTITATIAEAIQCHSAGAFRACALMVRRAMEELCADKQAPGANLKERIAALAKIVMLPETMFKFADELRLLGNDAAHIESKEYDVVGQEEVEVGLELCREVLKAVYQMDNLLHRLNALKRPPS